MRLRWLISVLFLGLLAVGCADVPSAEAWGSSVGFATDTSAARAAVSDLEDAIEKKEEVDARLGRAVGRTGGLLTATQKADFVRAWSTMPDVTLVEQTYQEKAKSLATALDAIAADPEAVQSYGARRLLEAYEMVAKTPQASSALRFGVAALAKRIDLSGVRDQDIVDRIIAPSLAGTFLESLITTGSVEQAKNQTIGILERGNGMALKITGWLRQYQALTETDLLAQNVGISSGTTLTSLRTVAGLIAIWKLGDEIARGDAEALVQTFFATAPTAVTGIASATALVRRFVMGVEKTPFLDGVVRWSGKISTGIGIVTSALSLWENAGRWNDRFEDKVRIVSDVLAIGASILVLVGAGPVGPVLATVAVGLSFFADWFENRRLERQEQADIEACLPATGLDAALIDTIVTSEPALLRILVEDVKLAPTDSQWLLTVAPQVASADYGAPLQFIGIQITQRIWDLDQAETGRMLRAALGRETNAENAALKMDAFLRAIDFGSLRGDMTRAEANQWFDNYAVSPSQQEPRKSLLTSAVDGAQAYLATVN